MKKQSATKKQIVAATKTILKVEDKQRASWMLIGAILIGFFIMILTEIDL